MKVLHCIPSLSPLRGGPTVAALEMVSALRMRGVDARILTTNDAGPDVDLTMPLGSWFEYQGIPIIAFSRWTPSLKSLREFAISPGCNRWLARHLLEYDLMHVHALFSWPSTTAMIQARRNHIPYVISTIGQLNQWSLSQSPIRKRIFLNLLEKRNLLSASALHFTTIQEQQEASSLCLPTPTWIIPLGVHLPEMYSDPCRDPNKPIRFLFLSRLHPKKQLECLFEALALLQNRLPQGNWRLSIAGDGDPSYLAELHRHAVRLGLQDRCDWLGFLDGTAKSQVLHESDWFVLPSASENFGIAAIEALAAGTPPILSPDVGVADAIREASAGFVCSAKPQILCGLLEKALCGPTEAMQVAARNLAANAFSWEVIAAQLERSYSLVIPA